MDVLGGHTVTVERDAPRDRHGDPTGTPAEHTIAGCNLQELTTETRDGAESTVVETAWLFCPVGADIRAGDRIRFRETTYRVHGRPAHRDDLSGQPHHVEVRLRDDEGV